MTRLTGRWNPRNLGPRSATTNSARVELYTRYSFYGMGGLEFGALTPGLVGRGESWTVPLVLVHSVLCCALCLRAMEWRLGRCPRPVRLMLAVGGLSAVLVLGLIVLAGTETGEWPEDGGFGALLMLLGGFGVASITLGLRTLAQRVYAVLGAPALPALAALLLDMGWRQAVLDFGGIAAMGALFSVGCVFSVWLVGVVWELEGAHELRARLAVAEERLRFGRDLHDVMGRNLAVIALKSELAVQLAERGRPEAVAQMTEVQRIARESQREVREVVRGYREANLHSELEGARGVLEAAGIDCRIDGIETIEGGLPNGGRGGGQHGGMGLPTGVRSALGWVVREATTNVLRHGDPRRCTIRLSQQLSETGEYGGPVGSGRSGESWKPGEFGKSGKSGESRESGESGKFSGWEAVLIVENDGVPETDPAEGGAAAGGASGQQARGSGLAGLRERLAAVGGTLEAGPTKGGGSFRLTARIPLPEQPRARSGPGPGSGSGSADAGPGAGAEVAV
ncbi:histidine kinase [Streptomyces sp. NPDC088124]|uniref:sensor histidine kinase n=1 Tax=Streptomyces sp. NPDC088124 TaxID=3154654 RepID=UPI00341D7E89